MVVFYSILVAFVWLVAFYARRKSSGLEKAHSTVGTKCVTARNRLLPMVSEHAANELVAMTAAGQEYERVESKYLVWKVRSEMLDKLLTGIKAWKGKKLPYAFGVLDVYGVLALIDKYGLGEYLTVTNAVQAASQVTDFIKVWK